MPYVPSVQALIRRSTTSAGVSNLNNSMFITSHAFFPERVRGYSSLAELNADEGVPKSSNLYKALQQAFSVLNYASPIYAGRREVTTVAILPIVNDNTQYSVTLQVKNTLTGKLGDVYTATIKSGVTATAGDIIAALLVQITNLAIPVSELTVDTTDPVKMVVTPAADRQLILTNAGEFTQEYTTTEDGAETFSEIYDENKKDYYFVSCEERDQTFVDELSKAVEATNGSYPKQYFVSSAAIQTLSVLTDPYTEGDLMGFLKQTERSRTATSWHDQSTDIFPELALSVKSGSYQAGAVNYKFLQGFAPLARHPIKGRVLNTAEQGYISDRNGSWVGEELGISFNHGGRNVNGEFTDLIQITDWCKLLMEARILTALLNANNGGTPLTMTTRQLAIIKERIESVLVDGVNFGLFSGFDPVVMPTNIPFEDQADRILQNIKFTAYFAAKVNFVITDGNLTYKEEVQ